MLTAHCGLPVAAEARVRLIGTVLTQAVCELEPESLPVAGAQPPLAAFVALGGLALPPPARVAAGFASASAADALAG